MPSTRHCSFATSSNPFECPPSHPLAKLVKDECPRLLTTPFGKVYTGMLATGMYIFTKLFKMYLSKLPLPFPLPLALLFSWFIFLRWGPGPLGPGTPRKLNEEKNKANGNGNGNSNFGTDPCRTGPSEFFQAPGKRGDSAPPA